MCDNKVAYSTKKPRRRDEHPGSFTPDIPTLLYYAQSRVCGAVMRAVTTVSIIALDADCGYVTLSLGPVSSAVAHSSPIHRFFHVWRLATVVAVALT